MAGGQILPRPTSLVYHLRMGAIKLPGGGSVFTLGPPSDTDRAQRIIDSRYAFVVAYSKSKGWRDDVARLSIEQIMEIRSQPGWKNPQVDEN